MIESSVARPAADSVSRGWRGALAFTFASSLEARIINEPRDLDTLYRLRYKRYVEEQGKPYPNATADRLEDRLDAVSLNLGLFADGDLAAAVRLSWLEDVSDEDYLAPLKASLWSGLHPNTVMCSRLVSKPEQGSVRATILLFLAAFQIGLDSGGARSILSTAPDRCKSFGAIGYRETGATFYSLIFGMQVVMILEMLREDVLHRFGRLARTSASELVTGG